MTRFKKQPQVQSTENQPQTQQMFINVPIPLEEWNDLRRQIDRIQEGITATRKEREEELITIEEACKIWKVSKPTFHRWRNEGRINFPLFKIGTRTIKMKRGDVYRFNENEIKEQ